MCSIPKFLGYVVSCAMLAVLGTLSGCQSTTGKTASQTMSDAAISTAVQTKLTSDRLSNFPRIDVDTERGVVNLSGVVETEAQRAQSLVALRQRLTGRGGIPIPRRSVWRIDQCRFTSPETDLDSHMNDRIRAVGTNYGCQ